MVAYGRLKTIKVIAVSSEKWSLRRGSDCSDFTDKMFVFWISSRLQGVVANERCSHTEVRLYQYFLIPQSTRFFLGNATLPSRIILTPSPLSRQQLFIRSCWKRDRSVISDCLHNSLICSQVNLYIKTVLMSKRN